MSDRPSDGMELDELRDEYDWMYEFQSLMAERIRGDADVHNLVDYVSKLQAENAKLREDMEDLEGYDQMLRDRLRQQTELCVKAESENAKLRALLQDVAICASGKYCYGCPHQYDGCDRDERLRAEGIEVDA